GVGDQDVRAAAQEGHADACAFRKGHGNHDFVGVTCFDQPLGGAADAKGRERRQRYLSASARPERLAKHRLEIGRHAHVSTAISARSWAINAAIASPGVQTRNVIVSPGHSWPATLMSAVITVAIFG